MEIMRNILRRSLELFGLIRRNDLSCQITTRHPNPEHLAKGRVILVRNPKDKWACFPCPCGCGEITKLSLAQTARPRWKAEIDWLNRPTISPSIRQLSGCKSHYWIKEGSIEWCRDSGRKDARR